MPCEDLVDPALLRPGRLDKQLLCGFPETAERGDILRTIARKMDLTPAAHARLDLVAALPAAELFTGADLQAILYSAQLAAVHENIPATTDGEDHAADTGGGPAPGGATVPAAAAARAGIVIDVRHILRVRENLWTTPASY
jgi:SpoVK/Ycf46/Vps4 family AAA+-type ATPase